MIECQYKMIATFLIVGGTQEERLNLAITKAKEFSCDKNWKTENNPDLNILQGLTSIGIQDIRYLQNWLCLKPFSHKVKITIISQAENLTTEAQNALLKTLEEPPENSLVVLCAPDDSWLSPTIVSRCQIIQLPQKSQIKVDKKEEKDFQEFFKKITSSKIGERWQALKKLGIFQDRTKAIEWVNKMTFFTRKLLISNYLEKPNPNYSITQLLDYLKSLNQTKLYLQANTNIRLTLEAPLLDI